MLKCEYKILKYVSKNPYCYYKTVQEKFSEKLPIPKGNNFIDTDTIVRHLYEEKYISCYDMIHELEDSKLTGEKFLDDLTTLSIASVGLSYIEQKRSDFLRFVVPYSVTTLITIVNLLLILIFK